MSHYGMPVDEAVLADVTCQYEAAYQSLLDNSSVLLMNAFPIFTRPKS